MTDINKLEKTVLEAVDATELYHAIINITEQKSRLIKDKNNTHGNVDETYLNSQIAKLSDLHYIAKERMHDVKFLSKKMYYKFYCAAKQNLSETEFNNIKSKVR